MNRVMSVKKVSLLTLVAFMVTFLVGCGSSASPEEVAEKYVKALLNGDYGTMKKLSSESQKASVEKQEAEIKDKGVPSEKKELMEEMKKLTPKAEQAKVSEDGNSASVKVPMTDKDGKDGGSFKVSLVKEKDDWKVSGTGK